MVPPLGFKGLMFGLPDDKLRLLALLYFPHTIPTDNETAKISCSFDRMSQQTTNYLIRVSKGGSLEPRQT